MHDERDSFPAPWPDYILHMQQQSLRMSDIVNELLTLSKLELAENSFVESVIDIPELIQVCVSNATLLPEYKEHEIILAPVRSWKNSD